MNFIITGFIDDMLFTTIDGKKYDYQMPPQRIIEIWARYGRAKSQHTRNKLLIEVKKYGRLIK